MGYVECSDTGYTETRAAVVADYSFGRVVGCNFVEAKTAAGSLSG